MIGNLGFLFLPYNWAEDEEVASKVTPPPSTRMRSDALRTNDKAAGSQCSDNKVSGWASPLDGFLSK